MDYREARRLLNALPPESSTEAPPCNLRRAYRAIIGQAAEIEILRSKLQTSQEMAGELAEAARGLMNSVPDIFLDEARASCGNTNPSVVSHWREQVRAALAKWKALT